jgi:CBS domain-containing protein
MPTVGDVLSIKGDQIHAIHPGATVLEATKRMNDHGIGALVVMEGNRVLGIFTERDVLRRVVAAVREPHDVRVREVMTADVICAAPETDLDDISAIMKSRRIRHIPVCRPDGSLAGMISIGDVNAAYASNREQTIHFLNEYIYGRT